VTTFDIINGVIYLVTQEKGTLFALQATTERLQWHLPLAASASHPYTIVHGIMYLGSTTGMVDALRLDDHTLRWQALP
jgi:hypothetical protein